MVSSSSIRSPESEIVASSASSARAAGESGTVVAARASASLSFRAESLARDSSTTIGSISGASGLAVPVASAVSAVSAVLPESAASGASAEPIAAPCGSSVSADTGAEEGEVANNAEACIQSGRHPRATAAAPSAMLSASSTSPRRAPRPRRPVGHHPGPQVRTGRPASEGRPRREATARVGRELAARSAPAASLAPSGSSMTPG